MPNFFCIQSTDEDSEFDELEQYLIDNPTTGEEENAPIAIKGDGRAFSKFYFKRQNCVA